jgi:hypothetical protein
MVRTADERVWRAPCRWTFDGAAMDQRTLDRTGRHLAELATFDHNARSAMRTDANVDESAVRAYLEHHLDDPDQIRPVLGLDADSIVSTGAFVRIFKVRTKPLGDAAPISAT